MKKIIVFTLAIGILIGCEKSILLENPTQETATALKSTSLTVPDDFPTIQEAVDAADDGCTITINEGTYEELISIHGKNDITLIAQNALLSPPDGIVYGEGVFNIDVVESSNITVMNFNFNGKLNDETAYPIDRAIAFNNSSGKILQNKFEGYGLGIACLNLSADLPPNPEGILSIKISNNKFSDCYGQISIIGNYDMEITHNIINYSFDHSRLCDQWFPQWYGIDIQGGTGSISKNLIKFKEGSEFLDYSVGIRLMKTNPVVADYIIDMHNMTVLQNIINRTDIGIFVNSYEDFGSEWSIYGLSLLHTNFIQVEEPYLIFNNDVPIEILP